MAARLLGKLRPGLTTGSCATALPKPQQCLAEEPDWVVGGRYELLHEAALRGPGTDSETIVGSVPAKRVVLLLALHRTSVRDSVDSHMAADEVVLGFLADTSRAGWLHGWAQLSGPDMGHPGGPLALRQRCRGSWEVGGRYRVTGNLALREGIELDSEELRETRKGEEALVLTLGLYMVASWQDEFSSPFSSPRGHVPTTQGAAEPRLRAEVRTDSGEVGWLTVELPGGSPLLDPQNLYSPEAIHTRPLVFRTRQRRTRASALDPSRQGPCSRETWEVGGQYRALAALTIRQESDLDSVPLGSVKVGDVLKVHDVVEIRLRAQARPEVRLRVSAVAGFSPSVVGWISSTRKSGEILVDVRDHLEYLHVTGEHPPPPVGSHLTLPAPHLEDDFELGDYEDGTGQRGCLACGGAGCGLCDARKCPQWPDAVPGVEEPAGCLACGGTGCGLCRLQYMRRAPVLCRPVPAAIWAAASREASVDRAAEEAAPQCFACGGAGCSICGVRRVSAEHGLGAASSEEAAAEAPGGVTEGGPPESIAEAAPVPWDKADGLPVEEFGAASPLLRDQARMAQGDGPPAAATPDRASRLASPAGEHARSRLGSSPYTNASFLPEGPECDEWRPCNDPRVELEAPEQGCPVECHGGGLLGWTEPFLSCSGSRITRARAQFHPGKTS